MRTALLFIFVLLNVCCLAQSYSPIPGKIEAESYETFYAVGTENTGDVGGGQNVAWIQDGSWMDYNVSVASDGYYSFHFRIANSYEPLASLSLKTGTGAILGQLAVPQTGGWQGWQTVGMTVYLSAGNQKLRVFADKGNFNLNWFDAVGSRALSGKIEAESFDQMFGVQTEQSNDTNGGLNVSYIDDGDWLDYNVSATTAGSYVLNFRVANSYGNGVIEIKGFSGNVLGQVHVPQTGGWQTWTTVSTTLNLSQGSQMIRLYAKAGAFNFNWFEALPVVTNTGIGVALPGKIQAENYDQMYSVVVESTLDTSGVQNVGSIQDGSWMNYRVQTPTAGYYTFKYRIANGASPQATLALRDSTGAALGSIVVPQTGGMQSWQTTSMIAYLPAGSQTLKIFATYGGFNINWFEVLESRNLTGKIEAESFDAASDVQVVSAADTDGGDAVGYIDDGDYMDYNVKVDTAGTYTFDLRVSNSYGNGKIEIKTAEGTIRGSVDVPQTGGWQNWETIRTVADLPAGSQKLRIYANRGAFNLNWFQVTSGLAQPMSVITFGELTAKTTDEGPFNLSASSNNTETPISFSSSDPSVATVSIAGGIWRVSIISAGQVTITASQPGNDHFLTAQNVVRTLVITAGTGSGNQDIGTKIPIDPKRWYQLTNAANGLDGFFDGETQVDVHTGWGKVINNYEAYYPLEDGEVISLKGIKFFDFTGSTADQPMVLSIITSQWQRIPVATFTGDRYNGWVGPYPERNLYGNSQFKLDTTISNARYLILTIPNILPTEIEFYGSYQAPDSTLAAPRQKEIRLRDMLGVNAYEWNFQNGIHPEFMDENKMTLAKSFTGIRHYMDWEKLKSTEGVFSYNPTLSGSWNYDLIYERCKAANMDVLACLKTQPNWMRVTYPENERDAENVPVRYGKSFSDPVSYIEQARVAFQYAARYGSNPNVNPQLLSVSTTPRWFGDYANTIRIGLDLIKYIECDNERDKWWKGRKGYQTAREYAANLSAFYDGHKNTMGAAIGVKNADPNMKVVIAGLVTGPDYIKGMVDWCKEYRGYHSDGSVNLCWDIVNFHHYTDNTSSNQSGTSTRGSAPEVTNAADVLASFVKVSREISQDMPVWITEAGYDVHQSSPLKAIPIGNKTALQTQADWLLRTSLFSARHGIEKIFYYQMYDDNSSGGMFATSGLISNEYTRRPAADYFLQTNKLFGNYVFKESTSADTLLNRPIVDRYELEGHSLFILTVPSETGSTVQYSLDLGNPGIAKIYTPQPGSDNMSVQELPIVNGKVTVTAGETPIFVMATNGLNARMAAAEVSPVTQIFTNNLNIYPNPTQDFVMVDLSDFKDGDVEIKLFDASLGRLHKTEHMSKSGKSAVKKLNISNLPVGTYILELKHGNERVFRKVVKGI